MHMFVCICSLPCTSPALAESKYCHISPCTSIGWSPDTTWRRATMQPSTTAVNLMFACLEKLFVNLKIEKDACDKYSIIYRNGSFLHAMGGYGLPFS